MTNLQWLSLQEYIEAKIEVQIDNALGRIGGLINVNRLRVAEEDLKREFEGGTMTGGTMTDLDWIMNQVRMELAKAERKHPHWPTDPLHALAILGEEYGELNKAVVQATYEGGTRIEVYKEALQTAAMAIRFLLNFDAYYYILVRQKGEDK